MEDLFTLGFTISLLFGAVIVFFDGARKFDSVAPRGDGASDITRIKPRFLTTLDVYRNSYILYLALRLLAFAIPAIGLPLIFSRDGALDFLPDWTRQILNDPANGVGDILNSTTFPLIWALLSAGILQSVPFLNELEPALRRFAHSIALIPQGMQMLRDEIRRAPLSAVEPVGAESGNLFLQEAAASDFAADRESAENLWARFCVILQKLEPHGAGARFNAFLEEHQSDIDALRDGFDGLKLRMSLHRARARGELRRVATEAVGGSALSRLDAEDPGLRKDLRAVLRRAETALACWLRAAETDEDRPLEELRRMGFAIQENRRPGHFGVFLAAFLIAGVAAMVGALLAELIANLIARSAPPEIFAFDAARAFEETPDDPLARGLMLMSYTVILNTTALVGALMIGAFVAQIDKSKVDDRPLAMRPVRKYFLAAMIGALLAYGVLGAMVTSQPSEATGVDAAGLWALLLWWAPLYFANAFVLQLYLYRTHHGVWATARSAAMVGLTSTVACFIFASGFYQSIDASHIAAGTGKEFGAPLRLGVTSYLTILNFVVATAVSFIVIYFFQQQRDDDKPVDGPDPAQETITAGATSAAGGSAVVSLRGNAPRR